MSKDREEHESLTEFLQKERSPAVGVWSVVVGFLAIYGLIKLMGWG